MEGVGCVCEAFDFGCVYWVVGVYIFAIRRLCAKVLCQSSHALFM